MKVEQLNFNEIPFIVPTEKRLVNKLESLVQDLKECGSERTASFAIKHWNKYMEELETQMVFIMIKYSLDTQNKRNKEAQDRINVLSPLVSKYRNEYMKILAKARYRKALEEKYGKYLFKMYDNSLKAFDPKIMEDLVKENQLSSKYDEIMGGAKIEFRGQTLNTSQLGKFMQDKDQEVRREAAIAFDKWLGEHEQEIGDIYSQLVTLRDGMAKKLGFKNFVDLGYIRMGRTDYDAKKVKKYRAQVGETVVPVCEKLYKQQAKALGIKNPQYYDYNVRFASGNPHPIGDEKVLVNAAKEMYSSMSSETKDFFNLMMKNELMDLTARAGKAPGGFCATLPLYQEPFIFSNFNGTQGDVDVLTHEGGHAFQAYLCTGIKVPEYREATMESCEIHSMSMEFFAWPYMEKFFGEDADKYRYGHLCGAIEFLPYGISVDEFQHWVYEHPNATHEERCKVWREIENKYTPHKKYDECPTLNKGTYWLRQGHIFGAPFYYIDYTLAQVVAFQFLVEDRKNHASAWKKYLKLCKCGGKYPFVELLEHNHLHNPFEDGTVAKVMSKLTKILKEFDASKF